MASLRTAGRIALLALVALAVGATATQADPSDDFEAVYVDWVSDEASPTAASPDSSS